MAVRKPVIVFIFSLEGSPNSTRYGGFAKRLAKVEGLERYRLETVALENLIFTFSEDGNAEVTDAYSGLLFSEVDYVYFRSWSTCRGEATALANFLVGKGIPFMDTQVLGTGDSKVSTFAKLWRAGLPFPETVYCRNQKCLLEYLLKHRPLAEPFIVKDVFGSKGSNNFLISYDDLPFTLASHADIQFAAQRYVPNEGDYRIGIYAGTPSVFILRRAPKGSHLNNVTVGGSALIVDRSTLPKNVIEIAEKAAEALHLQTAGVDILIERQTENVFVLEVNQGSQIVTGAETSHKIALFNQALSSAVRRRIFTNNNQPLTVIGRRTPASLPQLGVQHVIAKIDSGAISSTLHAENIHLEATATGQELVFDIVARDGFQIEGGDSKTIRTKDFGRKKVTSTIGVSEWRYAITSPIMIGGREIEGKITLTDRSSMRYPLLIGRRLLRSNFLVNVELDEGKHNNRTSRVAAKLKGNKA